uniref:t-SNARE coiled-coil homology domain-containing protein n=1 Tax=Alexandrium monilatum TaxID=311494 RepID=A0A6T1NH22_9DINO|mmetsp:Transcript_83546/g.249242  ORF Transcript_83546/g.249242 Transcript_83546/m.249242 type:complete len:279 (+) Transcript_83546:93-929(+)
MSTQLYGIADFVKKLEVIAEECGEKKPKEAEQKDEFLRTKQRMYTLLEETRSNIHERETLLRKRGNCYETIQKGHLIRQHLEELNTSFSKLQELQKRAQGKRMTGAKKEEHQARYQDIRILKKHKDEVQELSQHTSAGLHAPAAASGAGAQPSLFGLRDAARGGEESARRLLTTEEQEALDQMKKRDMEIDKQVSDLGGVLGRLDPLAREIGSSAERQRIKAEALGTDVEDAEKDLESLNKKVAEVLKYEKNTNCCCQVFLLIALLCCVGFVFQQLQG